MNIFIALSVLKVFRIKQEVLSPLIMQNIHGSFVGLINIRNGCISSKNGPNIAAECTTKKEATKNRRKLNNILIVSVVCNDNF
jgi:hypothetical protein